MELKFIINHTGNLRRRFKLYLYGIEITRWAMPMWANWWFKLYLYGIEISDGRLRHFSIGVQIVPLWNWNVTPKAGVTKTSRRFKLYLYGIEIRYTYRGNVSIIVQIVPLWNWNRTESQMRQRMLSSNCTFMELKFFVITILPFRCRCSNCTFMELKLEGGCNC